MPDIDERAAEQAHHTSVIVHGVEQHVNLQEQVHELHEAAPSKATKEKGEKVSVFYFSGGNRVLDC